MPNFKEAKIFIFDLNTINDLQMQEIIRKKCSWLYEDIIDTLKYTQKYNPQRLTKLIMANVAQIRGRNYNQINQAHSFSDSDQQRKYQDFVNDPNYIPQPSESLEDSGQKYSAVSDSSLKPPGEFLSKKVSQSSNEHERKQENACSKEQGHKLKIVEPNDSSFFKRIGAINIVSSDTASLSESQYQAKKRQSQLQESESKDRSANEEERSANMISNQIQSKFQQSIASDQANSSGLSSNNSQIQLIKHKTQGHQKEEKQKNIEKQQEQAEEQDKDKEKCSEKQQEDEEKNFQKQNTKKQNTQNKKYNQVKQEEKVGQKQQKQQDYMKENEQQNANVNVKQQKSMKLENNLSLLSKQQCKIQLFDQLKEKFIHLDDEAVIKLLFFYITKQQVNTSTLRSNTKVYGDFYDKKCNKLIGQLLKRKPKHLSEIREEVSEQKFREEEEEGLL